MKLSYKILSIIVKLFFKRSIVGKQIYGSKKYLYYERGQHLTFLFQTRIRYEMKIQNSIRPYIKEGGLLFDIGANIGQYAIPFSEFIGEHGKVYCFEPDLKNYAFLNFNATINKSSNIVCCNFGVGQQEGESTFYCDSETGGRLSSFIKSNVGKNYKGLELKTKVLKLDTLINMYGVPDFVKIDVEGFELDVINGLTTDLTDTIWLIEVRENTKIYVFEYFIERGYECFHCENEMRLISDPSQIPGFANLIFKKMMNANF